MSNRPTYEELMQKVADLQKELSMCKEAKNLPDVSEHGLNTFFERSLDCVFINDLEGKFLDANTAALDLLGYSKEDIRAVNYGSLIVHKSQLIRAMGLLDEIIKTGSHKELIEIELRCKNGEIVHIETKGFPLYHDGRPYAIFGIARDITKRKKIEQKLRESEEKFRILSTNVTDVLWICDLEKDKFIYFSPSVEQNWGWTVEDALELSHEQLLTPESLDFSKKAMTEALAANKLGEYRLKAVELEHYRKDGSTCWVETTSSFSYSLDGKPILLTGVTRDISERRGIQEALQKSEEKFRSITERSFDLIYTLDKAGLATYISPAIEKMYYYTPEEIIGRSFIDFVAESDRERVSRLFMEFMAGKDFGTISLETIRKDGTTITVELNTVHIVQDGEITGAQGVIRDITQRLESEKALRESEEKYRLLVQNANDAIFIAQDGFIKFCNSKTVELSGYSEETIFQTQLFDLVHPDDRELVSSRHLKRLKGVPVPASYSFRVINKTGNVRWAQANATLMTWEKRPAVLSFIRDITEQKNLEFQLQQARKMEAIGTLAGGIAHDFNNILGSIVLNTEMAIEDVPLDSDIRFSLKQVLKSSLRAKDLIQQILTFSSSEENKKAVNFAAIIQESLNMLKLIIPSNVIIEQDIDPEAGWINANFTQIQQVVMNLLTNAVQAMEQFGGTIKIALEVVNTDIASQKNDISPGEYLKFSISDSGAGINLNHLERIFDPFFTTKAPGKGTGLGLSVVHGIVMSHEGKIKVESDIDQGTTFHIYFPKTDNTVVPAREEQRKLPTGCEKVLFVDDEADLLDSVKRILERLGYTVDTADNGKAALEMFRRRPDYYDIVLTDMTMPLISGAQLSMELQSIRPDIPIIICTGHDHFTALENAIQANVSAYIIKPFVKQEIAKTIRKVLDAEHL